MSLRQKADTLRQTIDNLLVAGVDMAVPILRVVNATADWCPPLKMVTGGALSIFDEVKKFKEDKEQWVGFGEYVASTTAKAVSAIKSYDMSAGEAGSWVEGIAELGSALQEILSEIGQRLRKLEERSAVRNAWSHYRDPGRIEGLKRNLGKALASFQFRTNLTIGVKLSTIEDSLDHLKSDPILGSLRYPQIAHHDSTEACLEGTRVDLTERIMNWCRNTGDNENRLMLLTSVAGAGKTSIVHTIADRCNREAILLLCFFFRVGEQPRPDCLFSGIARALASRDADYRTFIISALRKDPTLSTAPFTMQFEELVVSPLHILRRPSHPMVVIIDALDECDEEAYQPLAKILCEEVPKLPASIKFFVTSRHVDLVNRSLSRHFPIDHLTIDLLDDTNMHDCAAYIRFQLQELKNWHPNLAHKLQNEDSAVQEILDRAGGLFIWISTIFRYMKKPRKDPMRTLSNLLDTGTERSKVPTEKMMDDLYTRILKKFDWEDEDFAHDYPIVMGAIFVARQPLSVTAWDAILSPSLNSSVQYALAELAPLLSGVEDSHIPVRILHQSFRDFIVNRINPQTISSHCTPVAVGVENARVALRCTKILNEGLCSVKGLGQIENLTEKDEMPCIPPKELSEHFRYACRHIVHHLSEVREPSEELSGSIGMFLSQEATRWVEVCVRMECYVSILLLPEWAKLAVDHSAVWALANVLTQLSSNLVFFSRFQEAYEAANDSVVLCRYLFSVDSSSHTPHLAESLSSLYRALHKLGRNLEALSSVEESAKLYRQLVAIHQGSYTPNLAMSLNNQYFALSNLGQHSEALPFIEESVKLFRQLVAVHQGSYIPGLAASLNSQYSALSNLGRHLEALSFIEESVKLRRQLVAVSPESYMPDLAISLNNQYFALSKLGQHSEALPFIEESIKLYHQLVVIHPGSYTPDLALSLNNLYTALSDLGQHSKALPFIEKSVKLYRQLVAINPESYTPDLAMSLNNLCDALHNLGQYLEALPFIEESVKLFRQLATIHPGSYTPYLAVSLNNLRNAHSHLGQHLEALPFIEESVKLYRQLVAINSGLYTLNLAVSLSNLCNSLSDLGRHSEALPFIEESVKLRRQLVAVNPGAYTPNLAMSLKNLCSALSNLGRHSEGLPFVEESLKLYRQLVAAHPGSYTPDLAMSLNTLFKAHSDVGRHSEGLPFIEESVKLYRQLAAVHPGSYTPNLALSLNNLYGALSNLGRHSEGLPFIEESVKLYRRLVAIHPGSYAPDFAMSLDNQSLALLKLGQHSEALPFIEESVKIRRQLVAVNPGTHTPKLAKSVEILRYAFSNLGRHSEAQMVHI
ncbi:uncharacterized protein EI90DRAFT_3114957 [Cantharellus anzutake]|uniref:uncharacterized protein n=1 Tax=Cantharellus anzutake TaxID=1750568 RepID=UPI00190889C5|nr:uncharacterized protein EI90DRAFT_3114957 [Cantharellus anzutake]KAF8344204.1 hypothetical protein EI90DRAFT_3114957 [Cantharellus anzutake]